jgi:hypothetical protein
MPARPNARPLDQQAATPASHFPHSATCQESSPWRARERLSELAARVLSDTRPHDFPAPKRGSTGQSVGFVGRRKSLRERVGNSRVDDRAHWK